MAQALKGTTAKRGGTYSSGKISPTDAVTGKPVPANVMRLANGYTRDHEDPTLQSASNRQRRSRVITGRRGAISPDPLLSSKARVIVPTLNGSL